MDNWIKKYYLFDLLSCTDQHADMFKQFEEQISLI